MLVASVLRHRVKSRILKLRNVENLRWDEVFFLEEEIRRDGYAEDSVI